jgi:hypothetical protein
VKRYTRYNKKFDWTLRRRRISLGGWANASVRSWMTIPARYSSRGQKSMKLAGLLLLVAGWAIVVAAVALLPSAGATRRIGDISSTVADDATSVLAGIAVELIGLALAVRAHLVLQAEGE